ncbi:MAG: hypothetical protein IJQ85_02530 [Selenomonadaceae bacterium]|nr:hypothetical protein [Selenomonadaceae bacterium]
MSEQLKILNVVWGQTDKAIREFGWEKVCDEKIAPERERHRNLTAIKALNIRLNQTCEVVSWRLKKPFFPYYKRN